MIELRTPNQENLWGFLFIYLIFLEALLGFASSNGHCTGVIAFGLR